MRDRPCALAVAPEMRRRGRPLSLRGSGCRRVVLRVPSGDRPPGQPSAFSSAASADGSARHRKPRPSSTSPASDPSASSRRSGPEGRRPAFRRLVGPRSRCAAQRGRLHRGELLVVDPALLDPRLLPSQVAQVVELGAADLPRRHDLEPRDGRRVHRERPLDTDAERDLADGERLAQAAVLASDHDALEHLNPLAVPLDHPDVHLHGVAWAEVRDIRAEIGLLDQIGLVHDSGCRLYQRPLPGQNGAASDVPMP